jgi:hypothetical protein
VTLAIYGDGGAVFSVHESAQLFRSTADFDPIVHLRKKTQCHNQLLGGSHELSAFLHATITGIWGCVVVDRSRATASPSWERGGLSYVFSFDFIYVPSQVIRMPLFHEMLRTCLYPVPKADGASELAMNQIYALADHSIPEERERLEDATIARFAFRHVYYSWATAVMLGDIPAVEYFGFCRTVRDLQHAWFSTYVAEQYLDGIMDKLDAGECVDDMLGLDSRMSRVVRDAGRFTTISNSMATGITLKTYQIAARQSGLLRMIASLESKLQYVRIEVATRIEKRNVRGRRIVEFILATLTSIQGISAYKDIQATGGLSPVEAVFSLVTFIVVIMYLAMRK